MPLTDLEASRIADAVAALRPDWPARSVRTLVAGRLRDRAYADVAVALTVVACDPASTTPARVLEVGPWWTATTANRPGAATYRPGPEGDPCPRPGHEHERASSCRACRAEALAVDLDPPDPAPEAVPDLLDSLHAAVRRARATRTERTRP